MLNLLRSRKGNTDLAVGGFIIIVFIILGFSLPYIERDLTPDEINDKDFDSLTDEFQDETDFTTISSLSILWSVAKMFFWNFGTNVPLFIEICIFLPMRILLAIVIYRNIRSGGG